MTITVVDARRHLRIDGTNDDIELYQRLAMAEALIQAYIGTPPADALQAIQRRTDYAAALDAVTLLVLGELWMNRESSTAAPLSEHVKTLLQMFREPTCV
ncbi:head-tail connector protein [Ferribacterium limneticum]|uniref:head-tail connector protein n=1 Tax=Ferribacterium limneticum TaxID=76259 RepID=UPI001CFBACC6|nr:head-tail connector protein [Ferribacterium limneticum]UCV27004.1 head-tail connector protein [Ferribacterium limneticum]UCV30921.1 head-tail connector protein [Ferribacterium limneticum]